MSPLSGRCKCLHMGVYSSECIYFLIWIVSSIKQLSSLPQVMLTDMSKPTICSKGLWAQTDIMELAITARMEGEKITAQSLFTMEFESNEDGYRMPVCRIYYLTDCNIQASEGCFCERVEGTTYYLRYKAPARVDYSNNSVLLNGRKEPRVRLPLIVEDKVKTTLIINNNKPVKVNNRSCHVTTKVTNKMTQSKTMLTFCAHGLSYPILNHSLSEGRSDHHGGGTCLTVCHSFKPVVNVSFLYRDQCRRTDTFHCHLKFDVEKTVPEPPSMKNETNFKTEQNESISLQMVIIQLVSLVLLLVTGLHIYYAKKKFCLKKAPAKNGIAESATYLSDSGDAGTNV